MDETSTTAVDNSADATADPITATDNKTADTGDNLNPSESADNTVADDDKSTTTTDDTSASSFDTDLDEWVEKRGLTKPETEEQRQSLQDLRNSQREYTRARQAEREAADAKALGAEIHKTKPDFEEEDDDELDPIERRQNKIEAELAQERNTRLQSEFYTSNKVTEEEHKAILDIFKEKTTKPETPDEKKAVFDYWSKPSSLSDLLELAKARIANGTDNSSIVADEAARAEREKIAQESNATSPGRGAKVATSGEKTPEQQRLERFSSWD